MYTLSGVRTAFRHGLRTPAAPTSAIGRYNSTREYSSTMHENDPQVLESEKQRNLSKSQHKTSTPHKHAPGWNEYLASASEANVKADKSTTPPHELQSETVKYVKARHTETEGTETESNTTAYYTHDTVTGPLSDAKGKEEVLLPDGKTLENDKIHDATAAELRGKMQPTSSEENVKADRGEI